MKYSPVPKERELERVNAFYLQKEAEVGSPQSIYWSIKVAHLCTAEASTENLAGQEKGHASSDGDRLEVVGHVRYTRGRISAVWKRSKQITSKHTVNCRRANPQC